MPNWFNDLKKRFFAPDNANQSELSQQIQRFLPVIASDDFDAIEEARGWVQPEDIEPLIALYWQLSDWQQKRALVDVMQDQYHPDMPGMMLDFLRIPVAPGDEWVELAQAVALGFIDEKYDRFMTYYNDRKLLAQDVKAVLRKNGLQADPLPATEEPASEPKPFQINAADAPNQRLMDGATFGDLTAVKNALADGANINVTMGGGIYDGCSALLMALLKEHYDVAGHLIDQGADVNQARPAKHSPDRSLGQTPLWWAANNGHLPMARKLLDHGAVLDSSTHHGSSPLTTAASSGHLDMVKFLVASGANIHAQIYDGRKAFNLAVTNGHKRIAEFLLAQGNEPDEAGSSGYTPLMLAAENNFLDLAKLLVKQGADVNAVHPGPDNYRALRGWTPLVFAVRSGYVRMTKFLIQSGADVNYQVPAGHNHEGKSLPARRIIAFAAGKRAESIQKTLRNAGAE